MQDRLGIKGVLYNGGSNNNNKKVKVKLFSFIKEEKKILLDPRETPFPHKGSCTVSEWACRTCSS